MTQKTRSAGLSRPALYTIAACSLILVIAIFFFWKRPLAQPPIDEGRATVETFLENIAKGKSEDAWAATTAELRSSMGREAFDRNIGKAAALKRPLHFSSIQTVIIADSPRTEFVYQPADGSGTVRILLGHESGNWKIDRVVF